jgi:hypothetical protein
MNKEMPITPPKKSINPLWIFLVFLLGVCLLIVGLTGFFGLSFWGIATVQKQAASHATQTQQVYARATQTQQAFDVNATATVVTILNERADFEFIDKFIDNKNGWPVEKADNEFFKGEFGVVNGEYLWNFIEVKQNFSQRGLKRTGKLYLTNFDMYVDAKSNPAGFGSPCYGLEFRESQVSNKVSFYVFQICDGNMFAVLYLDGPSNAWTVLREWKQSDVIQSNGWNTLGILARKNHFLFTINNAVVDEMNDERLPIGMVGVFVNVNQGMEQSVSFDNFYLQER